MLSLDFDCKENDGLWVVTIHPGLITSNYGVHEVGVTVYGVQHGRSPGCTGTSPEPIIPTRALKTMSLKCCLPSTDTIDRQEKIKACI